MDTTGSFSTHTLGRTFGVEVSGVQLANPIDDRTFDSIRQLLWESGFLLFRAQALEPEMLHQFARRFGSLDIHILEKYRHKSLEGLSWLTNVNGEGKVDMFGARRAVHWHSDMTFAESPPTVGMLHARVLPSKGGGTMFADMQAAYDALPNELKARVNDLAGVHSHAAGPLGGHYRNILEGEPVPATMHPVVLPHPQTGKPALYVNPVHTCGLYGVQSDEALELLQRLFDHATRPEFTYHHAWKVGDLIIWDERSTLHKSAGDFDPTEPRVMLRAIVAGHG